MFESILSKPAHKNLYKHLHMREISGLFMQIKSLQFNMTYRALVGYVIIMYLGQNIHF